MQKRFEWGPPVGDVCYETAVAPNGLADVAIAAPDRDAETGTLTFLVPAHDPATHNRPVEIHTVLIPSKFEFPDHPEDALAHPEARIAVAPVPPGTDAVAVTVAKPTGVKAFVPYVGETVLVFDDSTPEPTAPEPTAPEPTAPETPTEPTEPAESESTESESTTPADPIAPADHLGVAPADATPAAPPADLGTAPPAPAA